MNVVEVDGIRREYATNWNELSKKQFLLVCKLFTQGVSVVDFKVRLVYSFLNLKNKIFKKISTEDIYCIGETLNFLLKDIDLTKNLISRIYVRAFPILRCYYGPSDAMMNCTWREFTNAHVKYEAYLKNHDSKYLDELVSVLYRRRKFFWIIRRHFSKSEDPRLKLSEKSIHIRAKKISKVNPAIKYGIHLFMVGVLNSLPKMFPNVYRQKDDSTDKSGGWPELIISLADGKTDDESLDRVLDSNMYNVFIGLEQKAKEYFSFIEKTKSND